MKKYFIGAVFGMLVLGTLVVLPQGASAQSSSELQSQIEALLAQIAALQAQQSGSTVDAPAEAVPKIIAENALLRLVGDKEKDAELRFTSTVRVTAGSKDLTLTPGVYSNSIFTTLTSSEGEVLELNSIKRPTFTATVGTFTKSLYSTTNGEDTIYSYTIPAGKTAAFLVKNYYKANEMFAGSYTGTVGVAYGANDQRIEAERRSVPILVVGEKSPYITEINGVRNGNNVNQQTVEVADVSAPLVIKGVRFSGVTSITIGGHASDTKRTSSTTLTIIPKSMGVEPGIQTLQLFDPLNGNSNSWTLNVGGVVAVKPSISNNSAKLELGYDAQNKESKLTAKFETAITAGSEDLVVVKPENKTPFTTPAASLFFQVASANAVAYYPQPTAVYVMNKVSGEATENSDHYTIPAGKTAVFNVSQTFNPKVMFADSYSFTLGMFLLSDSIFGKGYSLLASPSTNSVTVIGEVSPYISSVGGVGLKLSHNLNLNSPLVLEGVRFSGVTTGWIKGVMFKISPDSITENGTKITLSPSELGVSVGSGQIYIEDPVTGQSNNVYVNFVGDSTGTTLKPAISIDPGTTRHAFTVGLAVAVQFIAHPYATGKGTAGTFIAKDFVWEVVGDLPEGLTFTKEGAFLGMLKGIPTKAGTYSFKIRATNAGAPRVHGDSSVRLSVSKSPVEKVLPWVTSLGTDNALPGEKVAVYVSDLPKGNLRYYVSLKGEVSGTTKVLVTLSDDKTYLSFKVPKIRAGSYELGVGAYNSFASENTLPFTVGSADSSMIPVVGRGGTATTQTSTSRASNLSVGGIKAVTVVAPNGGETLTAGNTYRIEWDSENSEKKAVSIKIEYVNARGLKGEATLVAFGTRVSKTIASDGYYDWLVPANFAGTAYSKKDFKISVISRDTTAKDQVQDSSDETFTIAPKVVLDQGLNNSQMAGILESAFSVLRQIGL